MSSAIRHQAEDTWALACLVLRDAGSGAKEVTDTQRKNAHSCVLCSISVLNYAEDVKPVEQFVLEPASSAESLKKMAELEQFFSGGILSASRLAKSNEEYLKSFSPLAERLRVEGSSDDVSTKDLLHKRASLAAAGLSRVLWQDEEISEIVVKMITHDASTDLDYSYLLRCMAFLERSAAAADLAINHEGTLLVRDCLGRSPTAPEVMRAGASPLRQARAGTSDQLWRPSLDRTLTRRRRAT